MSFSKIRSALIEGYLSGGFGLPVAYENRQFKPPEHQPWSRVTQIPNQPTVATLGRHGEDHHDGIFQIDLMYPRNTGDGEALEMADIIAQHFQTGHKFTYEGQTVVVDSCGCSRGMVHDGIYQLSITIAWSSRTRRG